jgi:dynein intermediate chain 2, axonemal
VCFAYDPAAGATKFMIGCESGSILSCNRKAKNPTDRVAGAFYGHHGPVYSLRRHPFAAKYFLSVGDWTARIWAEDSKQPLITTRYHNAFLTSARREPFVYSPLVVPLLRVLRNLGFLTSFGGGGRRD